MTADRLGAPLRALPRPLAGLALLLLAAALAWSVAAIPPADGPAAAETAPAAHEIGDIELYRRIAARVAAGESYYPAAVAEHRLNAYPTRPFVAVRPPVLAWGSVLWGAAGWQAVALLLLAGSVLAWNAALAGRAGLAERLGVAVMLTLGGLGALVVPVGFVHELMAGLFLTLALGMYRTDRWWPTWLLAAAAVAVRELAVPFVLLWLALALAGRRWREAAAVGALLGLFAAGMALHAHAVAQAGGALGRTSPGWLGLHGPWVVLSGVWKFSALSALPRWLGGPAAVLALLGWIGVGGRSGLFASLWLLGMTAGLSIFARAENDYWAQFLLPLWLGGLALAPRALADLGKATLSKP